MKNQEAGGTKSRSKRKDDARGSKKNQEGRHKGRGSKNQEEPRRVKKEGARSRSMRQKKENEEVKRHAIVIILQLTGDVVFFDAYRMHRIMPCAGTADRVSATAHLLHDPERDEWLMYF